MNGKNGVGKTRPRFYTGARVKSRDDGKKTCDSGILELGPIVKSTQSAILFMLLREVLNAGRISARHSARCPRCHIGVVVVAQFV